MNLKFVDSLKFMSSSQSNPADNLAERFHSSKCKDWKSCLENIKVENNLLVFRCSECNKNYKKV